MKINKTILIGLAFIIFAGLIFITDAFNPIIRPITYLFLMGSSKGKDIIFFGLLGLFLILSQIINREIDTSKYLKISIVIGAVLLILGILLEVAFRLQMGIGLNTVFCSPGRWIRMQRHHFADKGLYGQSYGFASSYVCM